MDLTRSQKVLLITSGQPALNPRLVKEADTLAAAGYKVTVLYAYWNDWGTAIDKTLLPAKKWGAIRVGGDPEQKPVIFLLSRLIHKLSALVTNKTGIKYFAEFAIARSSYFLIREARKHEADIYIGHNLGALPATVKAAKARRKPCGFDAEDFHRYEVSDDKNDEGVILKTYLENKYIPQLSYLSASSPGINAAYRNLYKNLSPLTILNVFPIDKNINEPILTLNQSLKLFWFSQTIARGRGLHHCIKALQLINKPYIELHLLGSVSEEVRRQLIISAGDKFNISFYQPVSPDEIVALASRFDIGLAPEGNVPFNRDICLTNKIFTYMQAGLAIIASDTTAQKALLGQYPETGELYEKGNSQMLATLIEHYLENREYLHAAKKSAFNIARTTFNWEKEREKFLALIKNTLSV